MNILIPYVAPTTFSDDAIIKQLQRIFQHPEFNKSEILKKFLFYVVQETLTGNSNYLKEYTIAVKVLDKPPNFNPQKNCIVRIHAGRLRQALSHYYNELGIDDPIVIGIPKGKYVPIFKDRQQWLNEKKQNGSLNDMKMSDGYYQNVTFAILPFICTAENPLVQSINDSLCLQICTSLCQVEQISVIAYQAVKNLADKHMDLKELKSNVGFSHIITGGTQYLKPTIRINIQIIDCRSYKQIWSNIFECKLTNSNHFDFQDEICQTIIDQTRILLTVGD
jgi:TolB-like protein